MTVRQVDAIINQPLYRTWCGPHITPDLPKSLRPFLIALQFLTRFPVSLHPPPNGEEWGRSLLFYPLVGLLIGLLLGGLAFCLPEDAGAVPPALLLLAWVTISGGLHLDGLADSADAWAGGTGDAARSLEIMKDPRCGPVGALALMLVLLLKFATVDLAFQREQIALLITAPMLGRSAVLLLFLTTPYVRPGGLGEALGRNLRRRDSQIMLALAAGAAPWLAGWAGLSALLASAALFAGLRGVMLRRIGGATGDTAGALVELTESAALTAALLLH